jgi:hypothetical protein
MTADDDNNDLLSIWESAEAAIGAAAGKTLTPEQCRQYAKDAAVAILRTLSEQVAEAEEDDNDLWPDSDDLMILAGELEESDV